MLALSERTPSAFGDLRESLCSYLGAFEAVRICLKATAATNSLDLSDFPQILNLSNFADMNREDNVEQQAEEPETLGSLENELEAVANENPFSYQTET